ncbi:MAG: radical SAM family heme chaperone HemW [Acidobacteria bacterium]|nr:radical SAM family heme chaperone HemW [Acidobacteriota bacterium]
MSALAGLYLHIPFCHSKCTYCSFITGSYEDLLVQRYLTALLKEIASTSKLLPPLAQKIDTIYLGGGTPSIITPEWIESLLNACYKHFLVDSSSEITIEINPADINLERLKYYKNLGINRVSVGVQSFIDEQLKEIGRDHSSKEAILAIENLRKVGFDNISLDLIAGLPNQTLKEWKYNLSKALELSPEHLSIYLLEVKEKTTLYAQIRSGKLKKPDDDLAAEMYETLLENLTNNNYQHYEISNFAKSSGNFHSKHNKKYWLDIPYYGLGVSAHSYYNQVRYSNVKSTHTYIEKIENFGQAIEEKVFLDDSEQVREAIMLRLRLIEGINLEEFKATYNFDILATYKEAFSELLENNLIEVTNGYLRLTQRGILFSNEVFVLFV